jgi:hypothetical protein
VLADARVIGHYACVRGGFVCALVITAALAVVGCGGSNHPSGASAPTSGVPERALLARVLQVANRVRSYQFSETIRDQTTDGGGGLTMHGSGVSDITAGLTEMTLTGSANVPHVSGAGAPTFSAALAAESLIVTKSRSYDRLVGPPPGAHDWCWRTPKKAAEPEVAPITTLASLVGQGATVSKVGTAVVRGVSTTRYVVTGGGHTSPIGIWVDNADELRRIHWTQSDTSSTQTMTMDLFDFGAPVTIATPEHAPPCSP